MSGEVKLNLILRLRPQRLTTALACIERKRDVYHAAQRVAAFVSSEVGELDQRRHLDRGRIVARSLSEHGSDQPQQSDYHAGDAKFHGRSPLEIEQEPKTLSKEPGQRCGLGQRREWQTRPKRAK